MRSLAPASATPVTGRSPSTGRRPVRKSPSTRGGCSKPLKALVVLFAIMAVLHCSVLSGLSPWLTGYSPFDSLLFDDGSGGVRPGEGRLSRPVGVAGKPASALLKALRKSAVRTAGSSAEETLESWHDAVLPQLLSDRATELPSGPPLEGHDAFGGDESPGWGEIVRVLGRDRASRKSWLVVEVRNGLGNRLRALASAMAVARAERRPLLAVWVPDLHCNCSLRTLLAPPLPFALVETPLPPHITKRPMFRFDFKLCDYQAASQLAALSASARRSRARASDGDLGLVNGCTEKDARVELPSGRHLWWRSAFLMNHAHGRWAHAGAELRALRPSAAVAARIVATADMVGVHVRNVFDAPRDAATANETLGNAATLGPPVSQRPAPLLPPPPKPLCCRRRPSPSAAAAAQAPLLTSVEAPAVPGSPPPCTSNPDVLRVSTDRSAAVEQYGSEAAEQLRWYRLPRTCCLLATYSLPTLLTMYLLPGTAPPRTGPHSCRACSSS